MVKEMEIDDQTRKVIERAAKLYALSQKNDNEAEAASAAAKFQELLAAHNLDMAAIEHATGGKAARADELMAGGLYQFQRDLWKAVAELNFCLYWNQYSYDPDKKRRKRLPGGGSIIRQGGYRFEHRVVGRKVNIIATRTTADYLLAAIERLTRERFVDPKEFFTATATAFREGMAERIVGAIYERRREYLAKEKRERFEAEQRAASAANAESSTATGLTLATHTQNEWDANVDLVYGDGTSAKWAAERAEKARIKKEAAEEYTRWAAEHPEEARKEEEKRAKERRARTSWNAGTGGTSKKEQRRRSSSFHEGWDRGSQVSLDPQMEQGKRIK